MIPSLNSEESIKWVETNGGGSGKELTAQFRGKLGRTVDTALHCTGDDTD